MHLMVVLCVGFFKLAGVSQASLFVFCGPISKVIFAAGREGRTSRGSVRGKRASVMLHPRSVIGVKGGCNVLINLQGYFDL